jgi:predicted RNase H-like nuclease (RuvC/YqgF family)
MKIECTKTRFATEKDAQFYIGKIKTKSDRAIIPIRAYLCRCGAWHLTSKKDFVGENDVLVKQVVNLESQINKLKEENEFLKNKNVREIDLPLVKQLQAENRLLQSRNSKETEKIINADDRVKKLNETINQKNRLISTLRADSEKLIIKIMQLEKKITS